MNDNVEISIARSKIREKIAKIKENIPNQSELDRKPFEIIINHLEEILNDLEGL